MRAPIHVEPSALGNYFAWIRTLLATERTLKAETRTSLSLIAFGFTIVQFFEKLRDMSTMGHAVRAETPRNLGLALIALGIGSAIISIWQYRRLVNRLWSTDLAAFAGEEKRPQWTPTAIVLSFICLIGIFAFVAVLMHLS
jgi:putative membrane protein